MHSKKNHLVSDGTVYTEDYHAAEYRCCPVWWHISAITRQMLTCQIFMLTCQIFMLTCHWYLLEKKILKTCSCPVNAMQITTKLKSRHNIWQVNFIIWQVDVIIWQVDNILWQIDIIVWKDDLLVIMSTCQIFMPTCQKILSNCQIMVSTCQILNWQVDGSYRH